MAMDATALANLIVIQMVANFTVTNPAETQKLADSIAVAVVTHLTAAVEVAVLAHAPGGPATGTIS